MNVLKKHPFSKNTRLFTALSATIAILVIGGAALVGINRLQGSRAFTGHHARCDQNQAYINGQPVSSVQTGQTFQATVKFYNDGTTSYTKAYAWYMAEYNGSNYWNASGRDVNGQTDPGGTAVFNLTLHAPSSAGTYPLNWTLGIASSPPQQVANPCISQLQVNAPQPPPTPAPNAPGISVTGVSASSISLGWGASNNTSSYSIFRDNSQIANINATSYINSGLGCNTSHSYFIVANGPGGATRSNTVYKTTNSCSSPSTPGGTNPQGGVNIQPIQGSSNDSAANQSSQESFLTNGDTNGSTDSSNNSPSFAQAKHKPLWETLLRVFLVLVILAGVGFGGLLLLGKYLTGRKQKEVADDLWRKSEGL